MQIIRSDKLAIKADRAEQREALQSTLTIYRSLVQDLMGVIKTHWHELGKYSNNQINKPVEKLIHPTAQRPSVKYTYFNKKYYKFPSYLRRAAIMDAAGQVQSFMTRYGTWQSGDRKHNKAKPPGLNCSTGTFPTLYHGACFWFNPDKNQCRIKVRYQNDWVWMKFGIQGKPRYMPNFSKNKNNNKNQSNNNNKIKSPSLIVRGKQWALSVPVTMDVDLPKKSQVNKVLSVDVGINTAASWALVDATGTVQDQGYLDQCNKDRMHRLITRIKKSAVKHTRHGNKLPQGFKATDYRTIQNLSHNESHQISRQLINKAVDCSCQAIVVENLKGWRPKAGQKGSRLKQKFHHWFHRKLVNCIESKAQELGLRFKTVHARGTSKQAFDGSGQVKRYPNNASICKFQTGKQYNADLNAAYNIAARGLIDYCPSRKAWAGEYQPKSDTTPRNPVTLSTLWNDQSQTVQPRVG